MDYKGIPCVAVFDLGRTNKKFLLFDEGFNPIHLNSITLHESRDEDGEVCEDLPALINWMRTCWNNAQKDLSFDVKALTFSTYGASFVHLDASGKEITPLYSYLKEIPEKISHHFYREFGDKENLHLTTASPKLGMLNSGMQLFWLKYDRPSVFHQIKYSLHFPQYCSWLFTHQYASEYTSLGCHTLLWDYHHQDYHYWVKAEGIDRLFPEIHTSEWNGYTPFRERLIPVGTGLHDSSAALIPYLHKTREPFLVLSTGTWGITLNPFSTQPLVLEELQKDCLNYLTPQAKPVKASRFFLGKIHDQVTLQMARHFHLEEQFHKKMPMYKVADFLEVPNIKEKEFTIPGQEPFQPDLSRYSSYGEAYLHFIRALAQKQAQSVLLAAEGAQNFRTLFIDGGFSKNQIFLKMMGEALPGWKMETPGFSEGTALGAAMHLNIFDLR
ncbi:MAG: FGGY-family carbohydrate kinase [Chitinophagaceae bacterium]